MKAIKLVILVVAVAIILTLAGQTQAQVKPELKSIIDTVVEKAKSTALNSRSVKWDSIQLEMYQTAKNAKSVQDLRQSFETLLVSLKDRHGMFYDPANNSRIAGYPAYQGSEISLKEFKDNGQVKFDYRILKNNIRYIRLVAEPSDNDMQKHAELIRQAVDSLNKEEAAYWIVDLRYAAGGEMNSFFAGLAPLLDEGLIATSVDGKKQIKNLYTVHNGNFYDNRVPVAKFPVSVKDMRNVKIAVLTSKYTTGAAEILALAFKGRKNTRLIGETTAGQITGTTSVTISSNLIMSISETRYDDRKGTSYTDYIEPHTLIEFIPGADLNQDKAITEANLWLTATPVADTGVKVTMK
jgi:carboxyl-terminal processing protease